MRRMRLPGLLLTFLSLATLTACQNVCDRMCDSQADLMERCFSDWESSWQEESYADREEFTDRCYAVWGDELDSLDEDSTEHQAFSDRCQRELQRAQSDIDCESLLLVEP